MLLIIFIGTYSILQVLSFQQDDYKLVHERIQLDFYNVSYATNVNYSLYYHTRQDKRFNASGTLLQDLLGNGITNTVQAYKFQSNEYREFPVFFEGNACDMAKYDTFGTAAVHFNTNVVRICPMKKGYYYATNVQIDESKFPPFAPRGKFMLEFKVFYNKSILLGAGKWYGAIQPTNPLEKVIL